MDIIIKHVRLSFPDLWTAREFKAGDGKPRWSATFLVVPDSEADLQITSAITEECKATFGSKWEQIWRSLVGQKNQYCYLSGDTKSYDGYAGMMALTAHRAAKLKNGDPNTPPAIIDRDLSPLVADSRRPYAGCYVNAKVGIYCQKGENPGVRCGFSVVQYDAVGDAFSAGTPSTTGFENVSAGSDAADFV